MRHYISALLCRYRFLDSDWSFHRLGHLSTAGKVKGLGNRSHWGFSNGRWRVSRHIHGESSRIHSLNSMISYEQMDYVDILVHNACRFTDGTLHHGVPVRGQIRVFFFPWRKWKRWTSSRTSRNCIDTAVDVGITVGQRLLYSCRELHLCGSRCWHCFSCGLCFVCVGACCSCTGWNRSQPGIRYWKGLW